jgi:hypothetical protein
MNRLYNYIFIYTIESSNYIRLQVKQILHLYYDMFDIFLT